MKENVVIEYISGIHKGTFAFFSTLWGISHLEIGTQVNIIWRTFLKA